MGTLQKGGERTRQPSVQELRDEIFRVMSAEEKLRLASNFSRFARLLQKAGKTKSA